MDELIKFLPIVLYLVYRLFTAGKGKQEKPQPVVPSQKKPSRKPSTIEDILRELREEVLTEEVKPAPVLAKKSTTSKINIVDHQYDVLTDYEHGVTKKTANVKKHVEANNEELATHHIDLRQAVIYDAILNRPEY